MKRNTLLLFGFLAFLCQTAFSQKKDLTPADYGKWQSLNYTDLSPNGEWIAYQVVVQLDNDSIYVVNRVTNKQYKLAFASGAIFSGDNQWMAYRIGIPFKEAEKLRDQGKPVENNKMGLLNLKTGAIINYESVGGYRFSENGKYLAITLTPPKENKDKGNTLLIRNMADSSTRTIGNVGSFGFSKNNSQLAYIVETGNKSANSVELFDLNTSVLKVIASDTTRFTGLQWQKDGNGFAFYRSFKDTAFDEENAALYVYTSSTRTLKVFDPLKHKDFPKKMRIQITSPITVSDDLTRVFFGIKEWTPKPSKDKKASDSTKAKSDSTKAIAGVKITDSTKRADSTKPAIAKTDDKDEKKAGVDVWHWRDAEIQPRQKITYNSDKDQSLISVWNVTPDKFFQLAPDSVPDSYIGSNKEYVLIATNKKYKPAFKEERTDVQIVDAKTGIKKTLATNIIDGYYTTPTPSADGKYLLYFRDQNWHTYNVATGDTVNLTRSVKSAFWNTRDDHPATKPPFGSGGWIRGDKEVLLYDEYDIWAAKPDGKGIRRLTNGSADRTINRIYRVDYEYPYLDDTKPIYIQVMGDTSKFFGYAKYEKGKVSRLIYEDKSITRLTKAKESEVFAYVKQDYNVSPELYTTTNFTTSTKVTGTNPQQSDYNWGKSELVNFTNRKGQKLQGALFYPANYQPGKKYPMIVYIYELLSSTVHSYQNPSVRSAYNTTNFTTGGYFVFRPDIVYDINDPGMSAVNCVVPAVEEVIKTGMIDTEQVGLMGHSWGAYQTSFIITQTDLFKAACAGAPLTDLISMSMSIYWNSGTPDAQIFETSQGRFDGPWYDRLEEHTRNSPMFNAARIKAPLLVAFGDKDGAVDWHQGIEMYGTMRRMEKPHVMLVYADENHGLVKKENQIDYQKRQREWFDHYLLKKPAPKWITEGVSYLEKMKENK